METTNLLALQTVEQAITDRLELLAQREHERELKRIEEERKLLVAKADFAQALADCIAAHFGIALDPAYLYANVAHDYADYFRFTTEFDAPRLDDGRAVRASLYMRYSTTAKDLRESRRPTWVGLRNISRRGDGSFDDDDHFPDMYKCESSDFVEAITFAKTGKR